MLVTQLCPTLCNPMDHDPQGSSIHGILQARILDWVAISFSRGSSQPRDQTRVSCIAGRFFTVWTIRVIFAAAAAAAKSPQSCPTLWDPIDGSPLGSSRLLYPWNSPGKNTGLSCHALLQGIFLIQESNQVSCIAGGFFTTSASWEAFTQYAAAAAKSLQSCPTLCDPIDCSPPASPVPGILQARTLEWVAIAFSTHSVYPPLIYCVWVVSPERLFCLNKENRQFSVSLPNFNNIWRQYDKVDVL